MPPKIPGLATLPVLPISEVLPKLQQSLAQHHELVLEAPPGAGKTTLAPLALLSESWLTGQRIIMLEPRRMAARAAAQRHQSGHPHLRGSVNGDHSARPAPPAAAARRAGAR